MYEVTDRTIAKLPITLPYDMYLHSCEVMNQRIWACSPGRGRGTACLSFGEFVIFLLLKNKMTMNTKKRIYQKNYPSIFRNFLFLMLYYPLTSLIEEMDTAGY